MAKKSNLIIRIYKPVAFVFLNTVLILLFLELLASITLNLIESSTIRDVVASATGKPNDLVRHHYLTLPYYSKQSWAQKYWEEHKRSMRKTYHPYVIWRTPPFQGETVNIDSDGIRDTLSSNCVDDAYKIYVFGGSAIWGWGAPDWGTIPYFLQDELQSKLDIPVCVTNFGEQAFVSTQNLIQLQLLLEEGKVPDMVIFYDGVNEVFAASQAGMPILHQNYGEIVDRFNGGFSLMTWIQKTNFYRLLSKFLAYFGISWKGSGHFQREAESSHLVDRVVHAYLSNCKTVSALADAYGFDCYFFWQPYILIGKKDLTLEEKQMLAGLNWVFPLNEEVAKLFLDTYQKIENRSPEFDNLHSLVHVFDEVKQQVWIDTWGHVTPEGNRIVAQEMLKIIEESRKERAGL